MSVRSSTSRFGAASDSDHRDWLRQSCLVRPLPCLLHPPSQLTGTRNSVALVTTEIVIALLRSLSPHWKMQVNQFGITPHVIRSAATAQMRSLHAPGIIEKEFNNESSGKLPLHDQYCNASVCGSSSDTLPECQPVRATRLISCKAKYHNVILLATLFMKIL